MENELFVRPAVPDDLRYVVSTWRRDRNARAPRGMGKPAWIAWSDPLIDASLQMDEIFVCHDAAGALHGWIVARDTPGGLVPIWVYRAHAMRGLGITKLLIEATKGDQWKSNSSV